VTPVPESSHDLVRLYDEVVDDVYGYLLRRCGSRAIAEDLTSETFLAAAGQVRRGTVPTAPWVMTVARNKLVDHWRRSEREERWLRLVEASADDEAVPEFGGFDADAGLAVLHALGPHHVSVLTLRYLDGLAVPHVAAELGRTVHATEALLQRAKHAFRAEYDRRREEDR
jgi:RNA polymerase sigma-70 factor, ECF subfamily